MFKQSSSRSQRTKGFKVKHTLQICVLVAVCVWLLYQVKHSNDRKKALEENSIKISNGVRENIPESFRFGRKDLPQVHIDTSVETEDHNEDDGNEGAEQEEPEVKLEDPEEEETKGIGEDEIDENDREGVEEEREHGEESEVEEGQFKEIELLQNKDQENEEVGSHEAREEHYRGDDASSAVIRDTEKAKSEGESLENGNVNEEQMENMENGNLNEEQMENMENGNVNEEQMENMENGNLNEEQMENMENGLQIGNNATETEDGTKVEESGVFSDSSVADLVNNSSTTDISLMEGEHESESTANSTSAEFSNETEQKNNLANSASATELQNNLTDLAIATEQQNNLTDLVNATKQQKNLTDYGNEIEQQNNSTDSTNETEQQNNSTDSANKNEQQNNSTDSTNETEQQNNLRMEIQNSSSVPVDVESDNSYLQNSTLSMNGSLGEISTNVIDTSVENTNSNPAEDSSNAEDGNSDSQKILIEQVENSNTTHETQEAEDASGISTEGDSVASEEEAAAHVDSNDPLAKADVVTEEAGVGARADLSTLPETEAKTEDVAAE